MPPAEPSLGCLSLALFSRNSSVCSKGDAAETWILEPQALSPYPAKVMLGSSSRSTVVVVLGLGL